LHSLFLEGGKSNEKGGEKKKKKERAWDALHHRHSLNKGKEGKREGKKKEGYVTRQTFNTSNILSLITRLYTPEER